MAEGNQKLYFVELEEIFRQIGKTPEWAIEEGYDPETDRQVAVFGDRNALEKWRREKELDEERYPIHNSRMGIHIDVYGEEMITSLMVGEGIVDALWYFKEVLHRYD